MQRRSEQHRTWDSTRPRSALNQIKRPTNHHKTTSYEDNSQHGRVQKLLQIAHKEQHSQQPCELITRREGNTALCRNGTQDLSNTNAKQLGDLTAHIDVSDLSKIPGWTLQTSDSLDVSPDTSTRGRRQIQKKIDENNSHMERISIEIDRAERREARHHIYTNRKPLADQDASKLERHIRQTSTWKREEAKYRRLSLLAQRRTQKSQTTPVRTTIHTNTPCLGRGLAIHPHDKTRNGKSQRK